jgi:16S rRNA (guanine527-N7)-methyltransferase
LAGCSDVARADVGRPNVRQAVFHVKHEGLPAAVAELGITLDRAELDRLRRFEALLRDRAVTAGIVAVSDSARVWERHVLDSLRGVAAVRRRDRSAYDLGSGAGLPGIVVAIACPELAVTLVESRGRRVAFCELAIERLRLPNARVHAGRVEDLTEPVDLCFARAFADATTSWRVASRILAPGGRLAYFAGEAFDASADVPDGVDARILSTALAPAGPLVIMSRQ